MVFVDGCTRWYKITELEPAPTDPAPEDVMRETVDESGGIGAGSMGPPCGGEVGSEIAALREKLAAVEKERDDSHATLKRIWSMLPDNPPPPCSIFDRIESLAKERDQAKAYESSLDSRLTAIMATLDRVCPAVEEGECGPLVIPPSERIERIVRDRDEAISNHERTCETVENLKKERDEARAECEGLRTDIRNLEERCEDLDRDNAAWKAESRDRRSGPTGREAREFEREAFLRFYLAFWRDGEMEGHDALQHAKARAAAARAAMFPKEQKS